MPVSKHLQNSVSDGTFSVDVKYKTDIKSNIKVHIEWEISFLTVNQRYFSKRIFKIVQNLRHTSVVHQPMHWKSVKYWDEFVDIVFWRKNQDPNPTMSKMPCLVHWMFRKVRLVLQNVDSVQTECTRSMQWIARKHLKMVAVDRWTIV